MNSDFNLAVHALVYLNHKADVVASEALAENICTNPVRVRRVLARLSKAGLVQTREGRGRGGYSFPHPAQAVTLRAIYEALDTRFLGTAWRSGDPHMACKVASGMAGVMDAVYRNMEQACRDYLETVTIADIDRLLFQTTEPERGEG